MNLNDRLHSILEKDKKTNPKYLQNVIKSDFFYLISNYFEVDFNDIIVDFDTIDNGYQISVSCYGERMKTMRSIPE